MSVKFALIHSQVVFQSVQKLKRTSMVVFTTRLINAVYSLTIWLSEAVAYADKQRVYIRIGPNRCSCVMLERCKVYCGPKL